MAPSRLRFGIFLAPFHKPGINPTLALEYELVARHVMPRFQGHHEATVGAA